MPGIPKAHLRYGGERELALVKYLLGARHFTYILSYSLHSSPATYVQLPSHTLSSLKMELLDDTPN